MPNLKNQSDQEFSEQQIVEFQICFGKFDKSSNGLVPTSDIGNLLRSTGLNPTEKEVGELINWLESNNIENINFEEFKKIMKKMWDNTDQVKQLQTALDMLDSKNNGFLTVEQLKKILLNLGEKIDEEDFKELLKHVNVQPDGTINNEDLIKLLSTQFKPE